MPATATYARPNSRATIAKNPSRPLVRPRRPDTRIATPSTTVAMPSQAAAKPRAVGRSPAVQAVRGQEQGPGQQDHAQRDADGGAARATQVRGPGARCRPAAAVGRAGGGPVRPGPAPAGTGRGRRRSRRPGRRTGGSRPAGRRERGGVPGAPARGGGSGRGARGRRAVPGVGTPRRRRHPGRSTGVRARRRAAVVVAGPLHALDDQVEHHAEDGHPEEEGSHSQPPSSHQPIRPSPG